eukprot:357179-Chlamydomonas_euryale.AAC.12
MQRLAPPTCTFLKQPALTAAGPCILQWEQTSHDGLSSSQGCTGRAYGGCSTSGTYGYVAQTYGTSQTFQRKTTSSSTSSNS